MNMSQIGKAIQDIKKNIQEAQKSPFAAKEVLLLAVTKTVDPLRINEAVAWGITAVGENRVQELQKKFDQVEKNVKWHLIGHLQTNKVKYIIDKVALIHSLDSVSLAKEINKRAGQIGRRMPVLVQVNVADEETKFGIAPEETIDFIKEVSVMPNIHIQGLMTIGPLVSEPEEVRPVFRRLRELRDEVSSQGFPGVEMNYLSMGMTNDYRVAIEEGANIVRVGSAIFGQRSV
jgi:pyridoxal phosphate enzyme (YggS family)